MRQPSELLQPRLAWETYSAGSSAGNIVLRFFRREANEDKSFAKTPIYDRMTFDNANMIFGRFELHAFLFALDFFSFLKYLSEEKKSYLPVHIFHHRKM